MAKSLQELKAMLGSEVTKQVEDQYIMEKNAFFIKANSVKFETFSD